MTLGQRITQYQKQLGVSQEELGARLGVSRQAVSKWETGAATPDMENLLALAREFGVSVAELTETSEVLVPPPAEEALTPETVVEAALMPPPPRQAAPLLLAGCLRRFGGNTGRGPAGCQPAKAP